MRLARRLFEELAAGNVRAAVRKTAHALARRVAARTAAARDARRSTYAPVTPAPLARLLGTVDARALLPDADQLLALAALYEAHRFDLLGTGWVDASPGATPPGFEGIRHSPAAHEAIPGPTAREAAEVRALIRPSYHAIDWHRDLRSGYRWPEGRHALGIVEIVAPGVDVKLPRELSRMHHLTTLAQAFGVARLRGDGDADRWALEVRDQVLDFVAANPPRWGVNWQSTMDVAIRVANILVAHDLLLAFGWTPDDAFERVLRRSVLEHAAHCAEHLELAPEARNNHYLADICGLLAAAAWLPADAHSDAWLAFALQELALEVEHQFHPDGSNFEASTCYHALSTELALYAACIAVALPPERRTRVAAAARARARRGLRAQERASIDVSRRELFAASFWARLERAAEFLRDVQRPDGRLPQIGDNDSGRFLRLAPRFERLSPDEAIARYRNLTGLGIPAGDAYWDEDTLDRDALGAAAGAVFGRDDLAARPGRARFEQEVVRALVGSPLPRSSSAVIPRRADEPLPALLARLEGELGPPLVTRFAAGDGADLRAGMTVKWYPGMGIGILRSPRCYLLFRCGEVGQDGRGGHAHNDQLSIELVLDGHSLVTDGGSYVYTPSPELRNRFRGTAAHFTPRRGDAEQSDWRPGQEGLFGLVRATPGECVYAGLDGFAGRHAGFGAAVWRVVSIEPGAVTVRDFGADSAGTPPAVFSNGYGRWVR